MTARSRTTRATLDPNASGGTVNFALRMLGPRGIRIEDRAKTLLLDLASQSRRERM